MSVSPSPGSRRRAPAGPALFLILLLGLPVPAWPAAVAPLQGRKTMTEHRTETATLAGGCFWCLEAIFERLKGVERVVSGYAGGRVPNPTYEQVSTGATGHAECMQVTFDPAVLSYRDLLRIFFAFHDPTTMNRQGPDAGTQYRSAIFWHDPVQQATARQVIAELAKGGVFDAPIVTEVAPLQAFYPAEGYHQDYYDRNPSQAYCRAVIAPKVAKLRKSYADRLKPSE
jgi:peptide-methionine (S)-S-oxide reductase